MPPVGVEAHNMRLSERPGFLETALGETISHDGRHEPSKCNDKGAKQGSHDVQSAGNHTVSTRKNAQLDENPTRIGLIIGD